MHSSLNHAQGWMPSSSIPLHSEVYSSLIPEMARRTQVRYPHMARSNQVGFLNIARCTQVLSSHTGRDALKFDFCTWQGALKCNIMR